MYIIKERCSQAQTLWNRRQGRNHWKGWRSEKSVLLEFRHLFSLAVITKCVHKKNKITDTHVIESFLGITRNTCVQRRDSTDTQNPYCTHRPMPNNMTYTEGNFVARPVHTRKS